MDLLFGPDEEKLGLRQEVERLKAENERLKAESTAPAASPSPPKPIALNSQEQAAAREAVAREDSARAARQPQRLGRVRGRSLLCMTGVGDVGPWSGLL